MTDIILRKASEEDLPTLLNIEQKLVDAERPYNSLIKSGRVSYYDIGSLITSSDSCLVVAESNRNIIGTGYAQKRNSETYLNHEFHSYLGFMYVDPKYRGKGVNKKIIQYLIDWSRLQGITNLSLDVFADNDGAIHAYQKAGFIKNLVEMKLEL